MRQQLPPKAHLIRMVEKYQTELRKIDEKRQRYYRRLVNNQEMLAEKVRRESKIKERELQHE